MIGILTQNSMCADLLKEILSDFEIESMKANQEYEALLVVGPEIKAVKHDKIITLGCHVSGEVEHIDTPISPQMLIQKMNQFCHQYLTQNTFENQHFIFQKGKRLLVDKETQETIPLTEKENDLLSVLAEAFPQALNKEELLKQAWNYKAELETHTLESHIYALRQKIGEKADLLFRSTDAGYQLVSD